MVERVDHLLRAELNQPLGLASPAVRILDPCCGTGAYLTASCIASTAHCLKRPGDDTALVPNALRTAALTRVFGFEIMPAPFVIAHLQIASLLETAGAPLTDQHRAGVYLTNALTGWVPERHPQSVIFEEFRASAKTPKTSSSTERSSLSSAIRPTTAMRASQRSKRSATSPPPTAKQIPGLPAPQGQGLNDLYIRFFRIAERRIVGDAHVYGNQGGCGIVCLISNNAWLDGLSHVSMRKKYIDTFQSIYIDNLNGDKYRTGKTTPDGRPDPSAFSTPQNREGIQVGTAISTLVRTTPTATRAEIHLRDLWGTGKLAQLVRESRREAEPGYTPLTPAPALGNPLANRTYSAAYTSWPRLPELFPFSFPGIKTSRDPLVVDIDRNCLEARMKQYLGVDATDAEIVETVPEAMESSAHFDPIDTRRTLQEKGFRSWQILRYAYRPFDLRWLYWEPETELLDRKREDFTAQLIGFTQWLEARQRESGDAFARGTIVNGLSDNFGNGLSSFFPAIVLESAGTLLSGVELRANLSTAAQAYLSSLTVPDLHLFFHALATMHTPAIPQRKFRSTPERLASHPAPRHIRLISPFRSIGPQTRRVARRRILAQPRRRMVLPRCPQTPSRSKPRRGTQSHRRLGQTRTGQRRHAQPRPYHHPRLDAH